MSLPATTQVLDSLRQVTVVHVNVTLRLSARLASSQLFSVGSWWRSDLTAAMSTALTLENLSRSHRFTLHCIIEYLTLSWSLILRSS
jgi:hypothetical protein